MLRRENTPSRFAPALSLPLLTGLLSLLFAAWLYFPFLNPMNASWLLYEGDVFQHYIGWQFFRHEPWQWPLGAIGQLATDMHASVVFTDSIPLMALLLKPFSNLLPDPFQYQGLWMLLSFFLNGVFATRLLMTAGVQKGFAVCVALLMSTSTLITARGLGMHGHEALTAHWVVFLAMEFNLSKQRLSLQALIHWLLLLGLAVLIHFYLFFMVGALWFCWWLFRGLEPCLNPKQPRYSVATVLLQLLLPPVCVLCLMAASGYFMPGRASVPAGGFGHFSAELLAFFNPQSTAWFFNDSFSSMSRWFVGWQPPVGGQYEGMSYVGTGVLLLWGLALGFSVKARKAGTLSISTGAISLAIAVLGLFVYAMAGRISMPWQSWYLYYDLPFGPIRDYLRSSGRMVWPLAYALVLLAALVVSQHFPRRWLLPLGVVLLGLSLVELNPWHDRIRVEIDRRAGIAARGEAWYGALEDESLNRLLNERKSLVAFPAAHLEALKPYVWLAATHQISINVAYLAGQNQSIGPKVTQHYMEAAQEDRLPPEPVYLITDEKWLSSVCSRDGWQCKAVDNIWVAWRD